MVQEASTHPRPLRGGEGFAESRSQNHLSTAQFDGITSTCNCFSANPDAGHLPSLAGIASLEVGAKITRQQPSLMGFLLSTIAFLLI